MRAHQSRVGITLALLALVFVGCDIIPDSMTGNMNANDNTNTNVNDNANTNDNGAPKLVVFEDPDSDFSTTDVRDVDQEIVQFDEDTGEIIWKADGSRYQAGIWVTDGNLLGAPGNFQVRFGTVDGQRRAYFTETVPATICDIRVSNDTLMIFPTQQTVPQE